MTFDEFLVLVQKDAPEATAERVKESIEGFEDHLDEGLARATAKELRSTAGLAAVSTNLAPAPPKRPASSIAHHIPSTPSAPNRTLATGKAAPVVRNKQAEQSQANDPIVARVNQRVNAGLSHAVAKSVGGLKAIQEQRSQIKDALIQEFAVALSPDLLLQEVMLGASELVSQSQSVDLNFDLFSGARESLAQLEPSKVYEPSESVKAWLEASKEAGVQEVAAIAQAVED